MSIQHFLQIADNMKDFLGDKYILAISDLENYLYYRPAVNLDVHLEPGMKVQETAVIKKAMNLKKRIQEYVPLEKSVYKIPYIAIATPIWGEGKVVGGIVMAYSTDLRDEVVSTIANLDQHLAEVNMATNQMALTINKFLQANFSLADEANSIQQELLTIKEMVATIRSISDTTHILGLNAAIEAARAGTSGAGFTVVAEEIRKLAKSSKEATERITENMNKIVNSTNKLTETIQQFLGISQENGALSEEIASTISSLSDNSAQLKKIAEKL